MSLKCWNITLQSTRINKNKTKTKQQKNLSQMKSKMHQKQNTIKKESFSYWNLVLYQRYQQQLNCPFFCCFLWAFLCFVPSAQHQKINQKNRETKKTARICWSSAEKRIKKFYNLPEVRDIYMKGGECQG